MAWLLAADSDHADFLIFEFLWILLIPAYGWVVQKFLGNFARKTWKVQVFSENGTPISGKDVPYSLAIRVSHTSKTKKPLISPKPKNAGLFLDHVANSFAQISSGVCL